jgi:hypothetical protein
LENGQKGIISGEVDRRLEDLFEEEVESVQPLDDTKDLEKSPLRDLKAILLSIEWEITDDIMEGLIEQVDLLKDVYEGDKVLVMFLQLLNSVGGYIKKQKANAHPDSIKLLISVYNGLEDVCTSDDMNESDRKKILFSKIKGFKQLKEKIAEKKLDREITVQEETDTWEGRQVDPLTPDLSVMTPHEAFAYALSEIKQTISAEFQALRAELRLWREGQ